VLLIDDRSARGRRSARNRREAWADADPRPPPRRKRSHSSWRSPADRRECRDRNGVAEALDEARHGPAASGRSQARARSRRAGVRARSRRPAGRPPSCRSPSRRTTGRTRARAQRSPRELQRRLACWLALSGDRRLPRCADGNVLRRTSYGLRAQRHESARLKSPERSVVHLERAGRYRPRLGQAREQRALPRRQPSATAERGSSSSRERPDQSV